jgi:hypothetical protein
VIPDRHPSEGGSWFFFSTPAHWGDNRLSPLGENLAWGVGLLLFGLCLLCTPIAIGALCIGACVKVLVGARLHCRFVPRLIHFILAALTYSVPSFLKRQCD